MCFVISNVTDKQEGCYMSFPPPHLRGYVIKLCGKSCMPSYFIKTMTIMIEGKETKLLYSFVMAQLVVANINVY